MNLPDSIKDLTNEGIGDPFTLKKSQLNADINEIIYTLKQKLSPEYLKFFDDGLTFYKPSTTGRIFINGIMALYTELAIKEIRDSSLENKATIIDLIQQTTKTVNSLIDQQYDLINFLNKKNNIDATKLSYTILGYAIETIKKIHHPQP
jgi:hypothetical protein